MQQRQGPGPGKTHHHKKRKKFGGNNHGGGNQNRPNSRDQQNRGRDQQQHGRNKQDQHGRNRNEQDRNRKNQNGADRAQQEAPRNYGRAIESHVPKRYGIVFYDTFQQARTDAANIVEKAKQVDQLNIVIKAEGDMNDPELKQYGMVYAGAAWHLIHTRRVDDGWYNEPR